MAPIAGNLPTTQISGTGYLPLRCPQMGDRIRMEDLTS